MDLKQCASILGWNRENTRKAIEDGIDILPGRTAKLTAERRGNDYDVSDDELTAFISACESIEPGRHPPIEVRRELLIEARFKCGICTSDAPLQFHHIIEWEQIRHHDPRHMLAVCGVCHDKITRTGQIDVVAQKAIKERLSFGFPPQAPRPDTVISGVTQEPAQKPPTVIDQSNEERLVWLLPRGLILLDEIRFQPYANWSVIANYFEFGHGWRQGTHYHKSYGNSWRDPHDRQIQFRKLEVPIGDWPYAEGALDLIRQLREVDNGEELEDILERRRRHGDPLHYFPSGAGIVIEKLPREKYASLPASNFRDLLAEIDFAIDSPRIHPLKLHEQARSLRHRGARVIWEMLPADHPSQRFIGEVVDRYLPTFDLRSLLCWLDEYRVVLREAIGQS